MIADAKTVSFFTFGREFKGTPAGFETNQRSEQNVDRFSSVGSIYVTNEVFDIRDPSAHRDQLSVLSAKSCLEYVIDVKQMLREMLSAMRI